MVQGDLTHTHLDLFYFFYTLPYQSNLTYPEEIPSILSSVSSLPPFPPTFFLLSQSLSRFPLLPPSLSLPLSRPSAYPVAPTTFLPSFLSFFATPHPPSPLVVSAPFRIHFFSFSWVASASRYIRPIRRGQSTCDRRRQDPRAVVQRFTYVFLPRSVVQIGD